MKLLLLNTDLAIGGTPTVVHELARRLPALGVDTHVACLGGPGPTAKQIVDDGIDVTAFNVGRLQMRLAVRRLRDLVDQFQPDAVLSFLMHANVVAAMARRKRPGPTWWQSIQTTQPYPAWHWPLQRWAAKRAAGVIAPSRAIAEVAQMRCRVPNEKIEVIPNGIDAGTIVAIPAEPRGERLQVGFLGRLDPVKNLGVLVAIAEARPEYDFHIFGDGPQRQTLDDAIATRTVLNVRMHGFADRQAALDELDVLVLPSFHEGFGLVLIEAMAAGVAVIGSGIPGIDEVIRHNETGLLVHSTAPDHWRDAIDELSDPQRRQMLASAALTDVRERFTWESIVPRYASILQNIPKP